MAQYWIESKDGSIHYNYDNYQSIVNNIDQNQIAIDTIKFIVAEGDDIDFGIFNIKLFLSIKCKIVNSTLSECKLESKSEDRNGLFSHYIFDNCNIEGLYIEATNIFIATINCNINKLEFVSCKNINELHIVNKKNDEEDKKYKIDNLKITDCSFNFVELQYVRIGIPDFKGIITKSLLVNHCIVSEFIIRKSQIGDLHLINNSIFKLYLSDILFSSKFKLENINYDLNNRSRVRVNGCQFDIPTIIVRDSTVNISFSDMIFKGNKGFYILPCSNSIFWFNNCHFEDFTYFYGFNKGTKNDNILNLKECIFNNLAKFDFDFTEMLTITNTVFQKSAFISIGYRFSNLSLYKKFQAKYFVIISHLFKKDKELLAKYDWRSTRYVHSSVWCTLKNQALAKNDNINALLYRKYEMNSYLSEIWNSRINFGDIVILFFNWLSNNHGYSWFRGLIFTFGVWIFFFSFFKMSVDNFSFIHATKYHFMLLERSFWTDAFDFLWLPQGLKGLTENLNINNLNKISYILMALSFILGKILIAYGIYQTVSAFRKHGKQS
jgi:hypothetical protein